MPLTQAKKIKPSNILWGIVGFVLAYYFVNQYFDRRDAGILKVAITEGFAEAEQQLSPNLPIRIDESTMLDSISFDGFRFFYHYTIDQIGFSDSDLENAVVELRDQLEASVCNVPAMVRTMEVGGIFVYDYKSVSGSSIASLEFKKGDC